MNRAAPGQGATGASAVPPTASVPLPLDGKALQSLGTPPSTPTLPRSYRSRNPLGTMTPRSENDVRKFSWSGRQSPSCSLQGLNTLETEVISACQELQFCVKECLVSELLPHTVDLIFLNLTTLEGQAYCIELTLKGWRVCSMKHDSMNGDLDRLDLHIRYFESIYSLLDHVSPMYRERFSNALAERLRDLQQSQDDTVFKLRRSASVGDEVHGGENNEDTITSSQGARMAAFILQNK